MKKIFFYVLPIMLLFSVPCTLAEHGNKTCSYAPSNIIRSKFPGGIQDSTEKLVTANVTFYGDLRVIWGSGRGYFDESTDSIQIEGITWNNRAQLFGDTSRRMTLISPSSTGVYSKTLALLGKAGDTVTYTYRAYPPDHFFNDGKETGPYRTLILPMSDSSFSLPRYVPDIRAVNRTTRDIYMRILVSLNKGTTNGLNGEIIPFDKVEWIGIKGDLPYFGGWGGNWTLNDTIVQPDCGLPSLIKLKNDGTDGDLVANDLTWTKIFLVPKGSPCMLVNFKLGIMYPGADTVMGGDCPLDNEPYHAHKDFVQYYPLYQPRDSDTLTFKITFGSYPYLCRCGIDEIQTQPFGKGGQIQYALMQNYPNPFNPTTQIRFSLPVSEHVVLKIYNVLGKEVATLLDTDLHPGTFETTFEPVGLTSGIYYYRLIAGKFMTTKKMMYIK